MFSAPAPEARAADAGSVDDTESLLVTISGSIPSFRTVQGSDGRMIAYPYTGWISGEGADGRRIAYPRNWRTEQGSDGRM
ncbi:hypothetical protein, partial [Streptomyces pacificus]|uniref:hypothetical protein n=1 Tax=Streptomyces pacificus TaxID=2705029 RepID=UPI001C20B618